MGTRVLVVDDEKTIVDILTFNLKKDGHEVLEAYDGEMALQMALSEKPDLILLDVMLPKMDGFTVCRKIREQSDVPILMLTAREEEVDKVLGLELGADDYITKPFMVRELMARVKANLRRTAPQPEAAAPASTSNPNVIRIGELEIDEERYEVRKAGKPIELTLREYELLKFLATQPERVFDREALLEKVWGYEYYGDMRTVDVTIRRLREKIEDNASEPTYIMTKRGSGYYARKD